jgi:hypothetical protein
MASRETIITALFTKLAASGDFVTTGRRNRDPESIPSNQTPALMLVEHSEKYAVPSPSLPVKRTINLRAILYTDVGDDDNAIPAMVVNNLLDGVDAALVPDDPTSQRCTLGGLAYSVKIDGDVIKAPGDVTGKGLAIVPLQILIP